MSTFNDSVPSFLGGVSQQAAAIRSSNSVDEILNMEALPTEGLTKRYPTEFLAELKDPLGASLDLAGARLVILERDDEDYLIALGSDESNDGYMYAWDSTGTPVACEYNSGLVTNAVDYLDFAKDEDIRTQQIADALFVSSRLVTVQGEPGVTYPQWYLDNPGAGASIRQGGLSIEYSVNLKTAGMSDRVTVSYQSRNPWNGGEPATWTSVANPASAAGTWNAPLLADRIPFFVHALAVTSQDTYDANPGTSGWRGGVYFDTPSDLALYYTNEVPGFNNANGGISKTPIPLQDFAFDTYSGAILYLGSDANVLAADYWIIQQKRDLYGTRNIGPAAIIRGLSTELQTYFDGSSADKPLITIEGNFAGDPNDKSDPRWDPRLDTTSNAVRAYFTDGGGTDDPIEAWSVEDSEGGDFSAGWQDEIGGLEELPVFWKAGAVVKLTGGTIDKADDEYIQFAIEGGEVGDFGRGVWRESSQPGLETGGLVEETMPVQIQRTEDGAGGYKFVHGPVPWATRQVGDDDSSKEPGFVGERIMDIFFHENRLGFLAGPGVVLSESGNTYNFWRTTLNALPDADPIDVTLANLDGDTCYHALPYDSRLFVFSEDGQAAVTSQGPLSPSSIEAPVVSRFRASPSTEPVVQGRSLFFPYTTGEYMQVRQVVPGQYQQDYQDSQITIGVPQYIPAGIKSIVKGQSSDSLIFVPRDGSDLVIYQYLQSGNQNVMAAWSKWSLSGTVQDCASLQDSVVFLITRDGKTYAEKMRHGLGRGDTTTDFVPRLDRQVGPLAGTYDVSTDATQFSVPFDFSEEEKIEASALVGGNLPLGTTLPVVARDATAKTLEVRGDHAGQPFVLGVPFESKVVLSKPYFKKQSPRGGVHHVVGSRQLCRSLNVHLADTGYLRASVDCVGGLRTSDEFLGDMMGLAKLDASTLRSADFRIPVNADVEEFRVTLSNPTAFPSTVVTGAWTIRVNTKKPTR